MLLPPNSQIYPGKNRESRRYSTISRHEPGAQLDCPEC
jgi:hypothetical protein